MATKTNSQRLAELRKGRKKEEDKTSSSKTKTYSNSERLKGLRLKNTIGLDTFESDLKSLGKTVEEISNGWQTEETMKNTRSSVESMYNRLNAYQEYQKLYGGTDLSELSNTYKSVLDGWDDLSDYYGNYKSADEYKTALETDEKMKTDDLTVVQKEIDDLQKRYDDAVKTKKERDALYGQLYVEYENAKESPYNADQKAKNDPRVLELDKKYAQYGNLDDLKKSITEKKVYKNKAQLKQDAIAMSSVSDKNSEHYDADYEKYVGIGAEIPHTEIGQEKRVIMKHAKGTAIDNLRAAAYALYEHNGGEIEPSTKDGKINIFRNMTEQEFMDFQYWLGKDKEEGTNNAQKFIDAIEESLNYREGKDFAKNVEGKLGHQLLFGVGAGLDQFASGITNLFEDKDYIPATPIQQASGMIRNDLADTSGLAKVGYDVVTTTANMLPSILTSTMVGYINPVAGAIVGNTLMGASAAGNGYQEMLNLGYDKSQARTYAALVGISEAGMQYALGGIGKLGGKLSGTAIKSIANGVDNAIGRFAIKYGMSMVSEGFEEAAQEVLSPFFENLALGYAKNNFSDIEWEEVAYSGVLGALSAGFLEGGSVAKSTFGENATAKKVGANIRTNAQVQGMLDTASLTPQESDAYNLYTQYAKKGVTAENVSDLQLGRLHGMSQADAMAILQSKKSTPEQIERAKKTLKDLAAYNQENVKSMDKKAIQERYGEHTEEIIAEGLESGKDTESYKLATELKEKIDNGEKVTSEEIAQLVDANENVYKAEINTNAETRLTELGETSNVATVAEIITKKSRGEMLSTAETEILENSEYGNRVYNEINNEKLVDHAETMGKEDADLFISLYDGKQDVEAYANSFNLVKSYAQNRFTDDYILEHKGVLSGKQASAIYAEYATNKDSAEQKIIDDLKLKHKNAPKIDGKLDDSVIEYGKAKTEGKVRWDDLNGSQQRLISIISAFGVENGIDVELITDGLDRGINGAFEISANKIILDVYAGMDKTKPFQYKNLIMPTFSHELLHWMKDKVPELYRKYEKYVFDTLMATGMTEGEILGRRLKLLQKAHHDETFTDAEIREEVVARASEDMLGQTETMQKFVDTLPNAEKKTFIEKVKEILQGIKEWFEKYIAKNKSIAPEAEDIRKFPERIDAMIKMYDEMLVASIATNQALKHVGITAEKNTTSKGDVKFADRPFAEQVDAVLSGEDTISTHLRISEHTPQILLDLGLSDKAVLITSTHTKTAVGEKVRKKNTHYVSKEVFKNLPQLIEKPAIVMESTKQGSIVMFVNAVDINKDPVICAIKVDGRGFYNSVEIESNVVTSVYGKDTNPIGFIEKAVDDNRLLYWDKKMSQELFDIPRLQLPNNIYNFDSNVIIRKITQKVNKNSDRDTEYLTAVNYNDIETAQRLVDEAARKAGYNSPLLYHGTNSFGFTEFDLDKMDDKRSIFLTSDEEIASTYPGVTGVRSVADIYKKDMSKMSAADLVKELNAYEQKHKNNTADEFHKYELYNFEKLNKLISKVNDGIDDLAKLVDEKIAYYADKLAADFDENDYKVHTQLVALSKGLKSHDYNNLSTPIYMLLHHTEAFDRSTEIAELEKNIRLMNNLRTADMENGAIVDEFLNGYWIDVLSVDDARQALEVKIKNGNYSLYAKLGKSLQIDGKGQLWKDIRHWSKAAFAKRENVEVKRVDDKFRLYDKTTNAEIENGAVAVNSYTEEMSKASLMTLMLDKANDSLSILTENLYTTREIAGWAKRNGYDSVVFYDILDNGGRNSNINYDKPADIYVIFNPNNAKSADPVTYDDNGQVIPLSERFDSEKKDIRYADRDNLEMSNEDYSKLLSKKPINVSKEIKAKINGQRIRRYGDVVSDDIPMIDFFRVADYNKVNVAYKYTIRNDGKDYFSVIKKQLIKPHAIPRELNKTIQEEMENARLGKRVNSRTNKSRNERNDNSLSDNGIRNRRGLKDGEQYQKNDTLVTSSKKSDNERYNAQDIFNNGRGRELKYSDRDNVSVYDKMGETDRLIKENQKLIEDVERLKERLKIERQVTHGNYLNTNQLGAVAGHLRNISNSNYSKAELVKELEQLYLYISKSDDLNWNDMFSKAYDIASRMISESKPDIEVNDYAKQILRDIRGARITVNEGQKQNAKHRFGEKYRNSFMGKVTLVNEGTSLDRQWQGWAAKYPDIFDKDISDADQLVELYNIYDDLRDMSEMVVEYDMEERTRWLAREIYNQFWNVSPIRTVADKYDKQIKLLNFEHRRTMQELRDSYADRIEKQRLADVMHYGKTIAEIRKKRDERLSAQHKADMQHFKEVYKKIRERKDKEIAEIKKLGRERMDAYKENAEKKTKIQSIAQNSLTLNKWLTKNSKDEHIHEAMKGPVITLLNAIDFSSKKLLDKNIPTQKDISLAKALSKVKDMMNDATMGKEGLIELYGHDMGEEVANLVEGAENLVNSFGDNELVLSKMSLEQLKSLDKLVKLIKQTVTKMNTFHVVHHKRGISNLSDMGIEHLDKLGDAIEHSGIRGRLEKMLKWTNATPYYAFKRLGETGKKVFEALQDGWDKLAFNVRAVTDFTNDTYTSKEVREWSKETKTFTLEQPDGKKRTFEMSIAQIMALHCVSKQEDAIRHLTSGGMTLANFEKNGKVVKTKRNVVLTMSDVQTITDTLSNRQLEVANKLQEFMNTVCANWGNEVSMQRFAVMMFTTPNYFPIKVTPATISKEEPESVQDISLFRLLNMSFTKSRNEFANQSIEIGNIFDVFAQHSSDMAKYNALALPVLDAYRWYSYKGKTDKGIEYSTYSSLENALGGDSVSYFNRFLKDLNGSQNVSRDNFSSNFFRNAKIAAVANNLRVVLLQPTAYVRASAVIKDRYLAKAFLHKPKIAKAEKYCGMALWKSMGYYDVNISKGVADKIKHAETRWDKAIDLSMKGAEFADKLTFGYLWNACELEIRAERKDLKVGSEEFYSAIAKRLREVIYATQVVDSTMTRSHIMRSADKFDKVLTAFMSEPTLSYNMVADAFINRTLDKRANKKVSAESRKYMARVLIAYTTTNMLTALIASAFEMFRDDEDEELDASDFWIAYFKNLSLDMSITGKLPYIKDLVSVAQGYSASRTDAQWMTHLFSAGKAWYKIISGDGEGQGVKAFKNTLRTFSDISGLAFFNVYRDLMAALNKLDILTAEELEELFDELFGY